MHVVDNIGVHTPRKLGEGWNDYVFSLNNIVSNFTAHGCEDEH
jgi:hypothetical protein